MKNKYKGRIGDAGLNKQLIKIFIENQDKKYGDFNSKLIPNISRKKIIGVRTPVLRKLAKDMIKNSFIDCPASDFLADLPHYYFEENQLHAFILSEMKAYEPLLVEVNKFLPYVDNWATCDQLRPKVFKKHKKGLINEVEKWIEDERPYTIRFAIGMLMAHFLDDDSYKKNYLEMVCKVKSNEYYVNMMISWYLATALAKQYQDTIKILENKSLDKWVHNKTIQKAIESLRISDDKKEYLKILRI